MDSENKNVAVEETDCADDIRQTAEQDSKTDNMTEDAVETSEGNTDEKPAEPDEYKPKDEDFETITGGEMKSGKILARVIGFIMILLAVICIIAVVSDIVGANRRKAAEENQALADEACEFINPVVAIDPEEFDADNPVTSITMLRSAAGSVILSGTDSLAVSDDGRLVIPGAMMEKFAEKLFGEVTLQLTSFDINEMLFEYSRDKNEFYYSASGLLALYTPRIEQFEITGDSVCLTVIYDQVEGIEYGSYERLVYDYTVTYEKADDGYVFVLKSVKSHIEGETTKYGETVLLNTTVAQDVSTNSAKTATATATTKNN